MDIQDQLRPRPTPYKRVGRHRAPEPSTVAFPAVKAAAPEARVGTIAGVPVPVAVVLVVILAALFLALVRS